jgi:predicted lipid-binding transport protein (Tim44 family)
MAIPVDDIAVERAFDLAAEMNTAAVAFVTAAEELGPLAADLADADARYRAAVHAAGMSDRRPLARELAAEVLHGFSGALRPFIPAVTIESGRRAMEALTEAPPIQAPGEE